MSEIGEVKIFIIGAVVGFLSGLLGKGGSAITTPSLQIFAGINPFAALASPLPATLPATLSASLAYRGKNLIDGKVTVTSILLGIPATLIGSYFSELLKGSVLMILTAIFVLSLGISFFITNTQKINTSNNVIPIWKIALVAIVVGLLSGLLANSGGVLFGPLFIRFLKMPTKKALACSLIVSAGLAVPGTIAHWYLGHIDWIIVLLLSVGAIPFSFIGAKIALRMNNVALEKIFAVMLVLFGTFDLFYSFVHF
jgi:uncharacterized membrane protein YfcA